MRAADIARFEHSWVTGAGQGTTSYTLTAERADAEMVVVSLAIGLRQPLVSRVPVACLRDDLELRFPFEALHLTYEMTNAGNLVLLIDVGHLNHAGLVSHVSSSHLNGTRLRQLGIVIREPWNG